MPSKDDKKDKDLEFDIHRREGWKFVYENSRFLKMSTLTLNRPPMYLGLTFVDIL